MAGTNFDTSPTASLDAMNEKTGAILGIWQENASRVMRANERVMNGFMSAAKLEIELGQELLACRMEAMKTVAETGQPAEKMQSQFERGLHEIERIMETMREVSRQMQEGFSDAAKLLFEHAGEDAKHVLDTAEHAIAEQTQHSAEQAKEAMAAVTPKLSRKNIAQDSGD